MDFVVKSLSGKKYFQDFCTPSHTKVGHDKISMPAFSILVEFTAMLSHQGMNVAIILPGKTGCGLYSEFQESSFYVLLVLDEKQEDKSAIISKVWFHEKEMQLNREAPGIQDTTGWKKDLDEYLDSIHCPIQQRAGY